MDISRILAPGTSRDEAARILGAVGFADPPKALTNAAMISEGVDDALLMSIVGALVEAAAKTSDPDFCLNNLERLSSASESRESFLYTLSWHPKGVKMLAPLLAASRFLSTFMMDDPEGIIGWLLSPGILDGPMSRDRLVYEAGEMCPPELDTEEAMKQLRLFKYRQFLRITIRDLLGRADIPETTLELSNIADAALEAALGSAMHSLDERYGRPVYSTPDGDVERCPFTVIAMGKHGGRELNFSSDIDIMYLYLTDKGETDGERPISNHQYFVKLGELLTKLIGDQTEDGIVFRVDLRLRPEGQQGDLAQSLLGYEIYYESWGQAWERSALIKARACAGDMDLGRGFIDMVRPFVYRRYLDYTAISEIRDMKRRIEANAKARDRGEIDLKLGVGGIREIEFFISALQLIYGGREQALRENNSLKALHRLALKDLITFEEQRDLSRAYVFLRTAEHRVQLADERQSHSIKNTEREIDVLARRMGYRGAGGVAGEKFIADYTEHTTRVREIYAGLFFEEQSGDGTGGASEEEMDLLLSLDITAEEASGILARLGFGEPERAFRTVMLLREGSTGSAVTPRSRGLFAKILPSLLKGCASSPDPDMALVNLEKFVTTFGSRESMFALIRENPGLAELMTKLFGTTEYISRMLITYPEMSDSLLLAGGSPLDKGTGAMALELGERLARAGTFADKMDVVRRFKHEQETRVGVKDVYTDSGAFEVSSELTGLAEVVLGEAVTMCLDDVCAKLGRPKKLGPRSTGIAVVGLGKLGGGELIYGSDLDIFFVYDNKGRTQGPTPVSSPEFYAKLSERLLFSLSSMTREGFAFRMDARLRPGGSQGVLANTLPSLSEYYMGQASVWEYQALTRARAVSGDRKLADGFERLRVDTLSRRIEPATLASEVRKMRMRLHNELGARSKGGVNIKLSRGGIVDIEFLIQYLQLLHGPDGPGLFIPYYPDSLELLVSEGLVPGGGDDLPGTYSFYRKLESRMRVTTGQPDSVLPGDPSRLERLALRMGYGAGSGEMLIREYEERSRQVTEVFDRAIPEQ